MRADPLRKKFAAIWPLLDERARRLMAANEAVALPYGGVSRVHRACGLSRNLIAKGMRELQAGVALAAGRQRRPGGGRKPLTAHDPDLLAALDQLIAPATLGDPESPLRWVCKSTRVLAAELTRRDHPIGHVTLAQLLHAQHYSLQGTRKTEEGDDPPDRDAQFRYINRCVTRALADGLPVLSVDTKKKELLGNYAKAGRHWRPVKQALRVQTHDFPTPDFPRAYPYGIYDIGRNHGFVNVGTDHDTGAFAVASIRGWWRAEGRRLYRTAASILITADAGGSNGARLRLWKWELQRLADETGLALSVRHFPPGTTKRNKVEHRLFLLHHVELAGGAPARLRNDRAPDRVHHDGEGAPGRLPPRPAQVPHGSSYLRRADDDAEPRTASLPRRLKLHKSPKSRTHAGPPATSVLAASTSLRKCSLSSTRRS